MIQSGNISIQTNIIKQSQIAEENEQCLVHKSEDGEGALNMKKLAIISYKQYYELHTVTLI